MRHFLRKIDFWLVNNEKKGQLLFGSFFVILLIVSLLITKFQNFFIQKRGKQSIATIEYFDVSRLGMKYIRYRYIINGIKYSNYERVRNVPYVFDCIYNEEGNYEPKCQGDTIHIVYDSVKPSRSRVIGLSKEYDES